MYTNGSLSYVIPFSVVSRLFTRSLHSDGIEGSDWNTSGVLNNWNAR